MGRDGGRTHQERMWDVMCVCVWGGGGGGGGTHEVDVWNGIVGKLTGKVCGWGGGLMGRYVGQDGLGTHEESVGAE